MNLNTVRVFVRDVVEAKAFYEVRLGLEYKAGSIEHGYCVFNAGNTELVVESVARDAPPEDQALVGRFTGLSFNVANVQGEYAELLSAGVEFSGPPEKQFWGGVLATFKDPAGNELQIVQRPAA